MTYNIYDIFVYWNVFCMRFSKTVFWKILFSVKIHFFRQIMSEFCFESTIMNVDRDHHQSWKITTVYITFLWSKVIHLHDFSYGKNSNSLFYQSVYVSYQLGNLDWAFDHTVISNIKRLMKGVKSWRIWIFRYVFNFVALTKSIKKVIRKNESN